MGPQLSATSEDACTQLSLKMLTGARVWPGRGQGPANEGRVSRQEVRAPPLGSPVPPGLRGTGTCSAEGAHPGPSFQRVPGVKIFPEAAQDSLCQSQRRAEDTAPTVTRSLPHTPEMNEGVNK